MTSFIVTQNNPEPPDRDVIIQWSDDAGANWSNPRVATLGSLGDYEKSVQIRRCGYSRNRIWRIRWAGSEPTALLNVFVQGEVART